MADLELTFLGAPRIAQDGGTVEVDTRKAVALLAYLAVTRSAHTREALCNLLWPEYDHEHARGALRRTLSTLRKAVGDWIETDRERVALRRGEGLRIDVDEFRERILSEDPGLLSEAVELYRGDLLAGFTLRDSVLFDDWQSFETDSLRRELATALDRLAEFHAGRGEYDAAVGRARRRLALNPLDEPAHRRLIELYGRKGERMAAVQQYRECVRILHAELGVSPVEETTSLYRVIQESGFPDPTAPASLPSSTVETTPDEAVPLVGRTAERTQLLDSYRGIGSKGRLVVIEGEMGIGKTRLADDFLASLDRGAATIAVRCHQDERTLAYAPVAEAVRTAVALHGTPPSGAADELARLLPEAGAPSPHPLDSKGAQTRFFET